MNQNRKKEIKALDLKIDNLINELDETNREIFLALTERNLLFDRIIFDDNAKKQYISFNNQLKELKSMFTIQKAAMKIESGDEW
jgi:hypothetical protein